MPKAFDTWQVFNHRPIEKLEPNLWRVEGDLPNGNGTRVMTIVKLRDGTLLIHNGIALEPELMAEIEAFGKPAFLVVPNGFHRLDSKVYKERYPQVKVVCPSAAKKKVEQVVKVDLTYDQFPGDEDVKLAHLGGMKGNEGVLTVKHGESTTVVFNDSINNLPKMGGFFGFLLAPTGIPSVPRIARWFMIKDKNAYKAHVYKLADTPGLKRVIVSHGKMMVDMPAVILRTVVDQLVA